MPELPSAPVFQIPEELRLLQQTVARFIDEEVLPLEKILPIDTVDLPPPTLGYLQQWVKEMGLWAMSVPVEYGGGGIGTFGLCLAYEEIGRCLWFMTGTRSPIFGGEPPVILFDATPEQQAKYLFPVIRGEKKAAFGQTEPGGGSDPASMATTAVRDGDNWVINGSKSFITGGDTADYVMVFAVTDKQKRRNGGITCFLVDKGTPGFKLVRVQEVIRPLWPAELVFEDCVVPDSQRLGPVGLGFNLAQRWLTRGRITYSARPLGMAKRSLKLARDWARQRVTFGQPLASRQAIQWMLVDSEVELRAARWLVWDAAWKHEAGEDARNEAAIAKLYSTEMVGRVIDRAIQVHGGMGVTKDLPLERWYREARVMRIGEGPSEIQRFIIARNLLRD